MLFPKAKAALTDLVVGCFRIRGISYQCLAANELSEGSLGWRLTLPEGVVIRFELPIEAPLGQPSVFLEYPDPAKVRWRNVELNGAMCLFAPGSVRFPLIRPEAVLHILDAMIGIVATNLSSFVPPDVVVNQQRWVTRYGECWSLISPGSVPCQGVAIRVRGIWLLAESEAQGNHWMANAVEDADGIATLLAKRVASFDDIPVGLGDMDQDQREVVCQGGVALFLLETETGPLSFAIAMSTEQEVTRLRVERADRTWLFDRGGSGRDLGLDGARIAIVGCGSLGAGVAELLVRSGAGSLALVDHDDLSWGNVARHALGGHYLGRSKARALATVLRSHIPTVEEIRACSTTWQTVAADHPEILDCDLIVSTIAAWPEELALAQWARERQVPLVMGWIEGHAIAGHAIGLQGGCLGCHFTPAGQFRRAAALWTDKSPLKFANACHENYSPYGYTDIVPVQNLIATLATDILSGVVPGDVHRSRLPGKDSLIAAGAEPSKDYLGLDAQRLLPGRWQELERSWPEVSGCWFCS